jgi:hypothetical protein
MTKVPIVETMCYNDLRCSCRSSVFNFVDCLVPRQARQTDMNGPTRGFSLTLEREKYVKIQYQINQ